MTLTQNKIGILGTGDVGQALGAGFIELGYSVKMGSRESKNVKAQAWQEKQGNRASIGTFAEAAAYGDIIVLATLWTGTENAIRLASPDRMVGKTVLDITNPLVYQDKAPPKLALGHTDSGGEQVQRWLPKSHVVKVFNTVGSTHMVHPQFALGPPDMFLGGNNESAKNIVVEICKSFGWNTIDLGGIEVSRLLEPMCILWVTYGMRTGSWNHAFKLLRK